MKIDVRLCQKIRKLNRDQIEIRAQIEELEKEEARIQHEIEVHEELLEELE